jgi:hypothetical protein
MEEMTVRAEPERIQFAVSRADLYPHTRTKTDSDADSTIVSLGVDRIIVETGVVETGRVTIALGTGEYSQAW